MPSAARRVPISLNRNSLMYTTSLIVATVAVLFLVWWHLHLRQAEALSTSIARRIWLDRSGKLAPTTLHLVETAGTTTTPVEFVQALRRIWLFSELDEKQIRTIAQFAECKRARRGESIVSQDNSDDGALYCVLDGYFKVTTRGNRGRENLINILQRGESFGEISFLDRKGGRSATVTALEDGQVLRIRRNDIDHLLHETPKVAIAMLTAQSRLIRNLTERAEDNAYLDVRTRLAKRLVALAELHGTQLGPREVAINPTLSPQDLGNMIQATRKSVSECMREWANRGVIQRRDDRLVILDRKHLQDVAAGAA